MSWILPYLRDNDNIPTVWIISSLLLSLTRVLGWIQSCWWYRAAQSRSYVYWSVTTDDRRLVWSQPLLSFHHYTPLSPCTMTKHSKNNTASSIFSYAEYKKLDYGTKRVSHNLHAVLWHTHAEWQATSRKWIYETFWCLCFVFTKGEGTRGLPSGPSLL